MRSNARWWTALGIAALLAGPALASGFSIYEQSSEASGMAGAWVARADDPAANWYNPAALTRVQGVQFQIGTNLITVGSDTTLAVSGLGKFDTQSSNEFPSQLYFSQSLGDKLAWGIGVNSPFGLVTEWRDQPITFSAMKSELVTFVINPNVAYKVSDRWSVALGLDYMYADVKEFSREVPVDFTMDGIPDVIGTTNLTGTGNDWSFNVATHYASDDWTFGLTYRGSMSPEIDGDVTFTGFTGTPVEALFPNGGGKAVLDLPAEAAIGLGYGGVKDWTFEVDLGWAGWSSFEKLAIDFQTETAAVQDVTQVENWDDTLSYRFGAAWQVAEQHEVRFGVVYDEAPIPEEHLRPSIPDSNRTGLCVGYGYEAPKWNLDAYYMALSFADITAKAGSDPSVIPGKYTSSTNLFGASFNFRF